MYYIEKLIINLFQKYNPNYHTLFDSLENNKSTFKFI